MSELIGIRVVDVKLQPEPSVLIHGKGRRERWYSAVERDCIGSTGLAIRAR